MTTLNTRQIQKLIQKLSPQQIQMIKLLELPTMQLEQRIKQEIEENPVLEDIQDLPDATSDGEPSRLNLEDYIKREETPSYRLYVNNYSKDDKHQTIPLSDGLSYIEYLEEQLSYRELTSKEKTIGQYIIGTLDSDGYLRREILSISDDIAFSMGIDASENEILKVLEIIQEFEPYGTGARTLQEALLLQLRHRVQSSDVKLAIRILENHFIEFAKRHFDKIINRLNISKERFRGVVEIITSLSPKPANLYTDTPQNEPTVQIVPDFIIDNSMGELDLSLNRNNIPEIKVNKSYVKMLQEISHGRRSKDRAKPQIIEEDLAPKESKESYGGAELMQGDKGAAQFIKQKIDSAKWFISAIKQRNATLLLTMHSIMEFQKEYFLDGDETKLRPMILKDIAEMTELDVSTISRVVNSKYVQTHFGIFPLKYFFSEAMQTASGEEVSSREIKKILSDCVEEEDKNHPLTDEALMIILQDKGYKIARRTVAKYREMLGIPVARLRRSL